MTVIRFLAILLLAFPAFAAGLPWHKVGSVHGVSGGSYTPVLVTTTGISIFTNLATDGTSGQWNVQSGTWSKVGQTTVVLPSEAIFDEGPVFYRVRTSAVQHADGKCYAMLTVGNGYPTTDSYRPAFATSDDCITFTYQGRMVIDGSQDGYGQTDTQAFVVREGYPPLDHANPASNKFLLYENYQDPTGAGTTKGLILVYSADGVSWWRAKDVYGQWIDVLPAGVISVYTMPNGAFPTATLTPYGVHIIIANTYPATKLAHLFSCDGFTFHVIESASPVLNKTTGKGTNLAYDASTNLLHALSGATNWTLPAKNYGC